MVAESGLTGSEEIVAGLLEYATYLDQGYMPFKDGERLRRAADEIEKWRMKYHLSHANFPFLDDPTKPAPIEDCEACR